MISIIHFADNASAVQVSLLLQEGMAMYGLSHKNILTVLGVSIEDHTSPFLIYPYQDYTNLKRFLQKCKLCPEGKMMEEKLTLGAFSGAIRYNSYLLDNT